MLTADEMGYASGRHDSESAEATMDEIFSFIEGQDFLTFLTDEIGLCMVASATQPEVDPARIIQVLAMGFFAKGWIARKALVEDA